MPRISQTGLYTWDRTRLGTLPQRTQVGVSPTGPVYRETIAPGATGLSIADILRQLSSATGLASGDTRTWDEPSGGAYFVASTYADRTRSSNKLKMASAAFGAMRADTRNIQDHIAVALGTLNEWEQYLVARRFVYQGITTHGVNPCAGGNCDTSVSLLLADLAAHIAGQTRQVTAQTSVSMPSSTPATGGAWGAQLPNASGLTIGASSGMQQQTSPAAAVIAQGGSGAQASSAQTNAVLEANDGSGVTQVLTATGPNAMPPGYATTDTLVDPSTGQPMAPSGLPSWWKPALAVALGAVVGVGVGRAIAG